MTSKKQLLFAYGLAIHLLLVGIICYAAFPTQAPDEPIRIMYQTNAGKVLFEHHTHTDAFGYGAACFDCHHYPSDDEAALIACGQCHLSAPEEGVVPEYCLECYDTEEVEDSEHGKRSEAIHDQCTQCHYEFGKGPLYQNSLSQEEQDKLKTQPNEWVDCTKCHI